MNWIDITKQLPPVGGDGHSEFVLAYRGGRLIPEIVQYCNGDYGQKGWWSQNGHHIPFNTGRGKQKHLTFQYWAKFEYPEGGAI